MKKILTLAICLLFSAHSYSQITFEPGYIINESNERIECEIKNIDWKKNPTQFEYKIPSSEEVLIGNLQMVKEFGINNTSRFIKSNVEIDESSSSLSSMAQEMDPVFESKVLFLKTLVEGKASLYSYENKSVKKYFYSVDGSDPKQLVYKKYKINDRVGENNEFRNQLASNLSCSSGDLPTQLGYTQGELEKYFIKFNQCSNSPYSTFDKKDKKELIHVALRPGLSMNSLKIENSTSTFGKIDFGSSMSFRIGLETEFLLPSNKNKWAVILEPTYQNFKSEKSIKSSGVNESYNVTVDYKSIELPIGFRHYFYLNQKSKLFINLSYLIEFGTGSTIDFIRSDGAKPSPLETHSSGNFALGGGFKYLDKLSLEVRAHSNRDILGTYNNWSSDYKSLNFIIGYSIF